MSDAATCDYSLGYWCSILLIGPEKNILKVLGSSGDDSSSSSRSIEGGSSANTADISKSFP
jgi:hypothetical protein